MKPEQKNDDGEELLSPMSPMSQALNSSVISLVILGVVEFETPITESETLDFLRNSFVPTSARFSSIMVTDEKNMSKWKKVDIQVEDHLIVPTFSNYGLRLQTREEYDEQLREYISKIGCERFPEGKPLWDVHLIKYPSLNGVTTLVFKISHAIGDGYSVARLLFFALKRAGNSSLPLSIPQLSLRRNDEAKGTYLGMISKCMNTISDLTYNILKSTVLEDRPNVIRSRRADSNVIRPFSIYPLTLSLERLKQVKSKMGATMNEVILGIISYMIHLYKVRIGQISNDTTMTILVTFNVRALKGYKNIEEMLKSDTWGNHARLLHTSVPSFTDLEEVTPLDFIIKAKENMKRQKDSMLIYLIDPVLQVAKSIKGPKRMAEVVHSTFKNASTMLTTLVGPKEQMALGEHTINSFYPVLTGVPQSLTFTSVSCSGQLKLVATMEKGFIDSEIFTCCMNEAFENIFDAAFAS